MTSDEGAPHGQPRWWKSSYSAESANCLEVAIVPTGLAVRDSKDRTGPTLSYPVAAWRDFVADVRRGVFDRR
jgi:Domain of unknown function (DUF397)